MIKLISIDHGKCKCGLVLADLHQKRVDQAVVLNTALLPQYLKNLNSVEYICSKKCAWLIRIYSISKPLPRSSPSWEADNKGAA